MSTEEMSPDISEEEAERRRTQAYLQEARRRERVQEERLREVEERLRWTAISREEAAPLGQQEDVDVAEVPAHDHTPQLPPGMLAPELVDTNQLGIGTTGTGLTWNDATTGLAGGVGQQAFTTYTTPAIDKELVKEALKEVLKELFEEEANFMRWLQVKYAFIPVIPEKEERGRTVSGPPLERSRDAVHTRRTRAESSTVRPGGAGAGGGAHSA